jgi:hypothetical protein
MLLQFQRGEFQPYRLLARITAPPKKLLPPIISHNIIEIIFAGSQLLDLTVNNISVFQSWHL